MRKTYCLAVAIIFCFWTTGFAEGTRELAPNAQITVGPNLTNDIAALYINEPRYNNFATYDNPNPQSRLHINIQDPTSECIYFGFSAATRNATGAAGTIPFQYRILDPNGNIVAGPIILNPADAQINNWQEAFNGPQQIHGPTGYDADIISSAQLQSQGWTGAGDFYIEFLDADTSFSSAFLINYFDITVAECSGATPIEKNGRLWSNNWAIFAINDFGFPARPFNGAFYVCAPDPSDPNRSFITKVDFQNSGFMPAAFNVAFNEFGVFNTGNISEDRKSVENINSAIPQYAIFLNDPVDICETAIAGNIELIGISRCDIDDFCIKYKSSKEGQLEILLDFDGPDGVYTPGTRDVLITTNIAPADVGKETCLDWDGKDGLGNPLPETVTTQIPIVVSYAQGIYHFPIYDAEIMSEGFQIQTIRPAGPSPKLYYDDSNITVLSGTTEPKVNLNGCNLPCHTWTNFTDNFTAGYGNINTINSWWFSSRSVTEAVFNLPGYYNCMATGPDQLCPGEKGKVKYELISFPPDANPLTIVSTEWTGPGIIGSSSTNSIDVDQHGNYKVMIRYLNATGDTCETDCTVEIEEGKQTTFQIDTLIVKGDTVDINGEKYTQAGRYNQTITSPDACDSLLIIDVLVAQSTILYDFNDCYSRKSDSTHQDYTEFEVKYPDPLSCADISAEFLRREMPERNPHSCTPGVKNSPAMCVSSLDTCEYVDGNEKAVVFEVTIDPNPDTAILVTSLCFFERSPEMYEWIGGSSGPNNYPTLYGLRILKNGLEIFKQTDIPTNRNWTKETYELSEIPQMKIDDRAVLRFELMGYCLSNDSVEVAAWDLDELSVNMACAPKTFGISQVLGQVKTLNQMLLPGVEVTIGPSPSFSRYQNTTTDNKGQYVLTPHFTDRDYYIKAQGPDDKMNGISTRDAILLYRYLLGRKKDATPEYELACDIDGNGQVSVRDVTALRRSILGEVHRFGNQSWIYGARQNGHFDQIVRFNNLLQIKKWVDLTGVKIGDLDQTAIVGFNDPNRTRDDYLYEVVVPDLELQPNEHYFIPIKLNANNNNIKGLQLFFELNGLVIHDVIISDQAISDEYYKFSEESLGISWFDLNHSGEITLTLHATSHYQGLLSELISLSNELNSEIYFSEELSIHPVQLAWHNKDEGTGQLTVDIFPNPTNDKFVIAGSHEIQEISAYAMDGQRVELKSLGSSEYRIDAKGLIVLMIKTSDQRLIRKIMIK